MYVCVKKQKKTHYSRLVSYERINRAGIISLFPGRKMELLKFFTHDLRPSAPTPFVGRKAAVVMVLF